MFRKLRFWWWDSGVPQGTGNVGGSELPFSLSTTPRIGHRYWLVRSDLQGPVLRSLHVQMTWEREMTAVCCPNGRPILGAITHESQAPHPRCSCGLYAELPDTPIEEWAFAISGRVYAAGEVALRGRILKCPRGYKAQRAEILSPITLDASCWEKTGGEPCMEPVTRVTPEGLLAACGMHAQDGYVGAKQWMANTADQLAARYQLEVNSFI